VSAGRCTCQIDGNAARQAPRGLDVYRSGGAFAQFETGGGPPDIAGVCDTFSKITEVVVALNSAWNVCPLSVPRIPIAGCSVVPLFTVMVIMNVFMQR
jgi:hypothetical protein